MSSFLCFLKGTSSQEQSGCATRYTIIQMLQLQLAKATNFAINAVHTDSTKIYPCAFVGVTSIDLRLLVHLAKKILLCKITDHEIPVASIRVKKEMKIYQIFRSKAATKFPIFYVHY